MGKVLVLLVLWLSLWPLAACNGGASAEKDGWYTELPRAESPYWSWPKVDAARVHEVPEAQHAEAEAMLEESAAVELTAEQAATLAGGPLPEAPGTRPYLVRGLYFNRGTGRFIVYAQGGQLAVNHGSLGHRTVPMKRQALILQLEEEPTEVFVNASMAE